MQIGFSFRLGALGLAVALSLGQLPLPGPQQWEARPDAPAVLAPEQEEHLEDVDPADWFYAAVRTGMRHGFIQGAGGRFEPRRAITRGEFITLLGRLHQAMGGLVYQTYEIGSATQPYTDMNPNAFYAPYLRWAAQLELVAGDHAGRFFPQEALTRQELAMIFARYIRAYGVYMRLTETEEDPEPFADQGQIDSGAHREIQFLKRFGLIAGVRGTGAQAEQYFFHPENQTQRAEAAVLLTRLFEKMLQGPVSV